MKGGKGLLWLSCCPPRYRTPWFSKCLRIIQSAFFIGKATRTRNFFDNLQEIYSNVFSPDC